MYHDLTILFPNGTEGGVRLINIWLMVYTIYTRVSWKRLIRSQLTSETHCSVWTLSLVSELAIHTNRCIINERNEVDFGLTLPDNFPLAIRLVATSLMVL